MPNDDTPTDALDMETVSLNEDTFCSSCDTNGRCTYACEYGMATYSYFEMDCD